MKSLHHLLSLVLYACGTAPSDEPIGCQSDEDCKSSRDCLEGICQERQTDAAVGDVQVSDTAYESPYQGILYALVQERTSRDFLLAQYDLQTDSLQRLTDAQRIIVTAPSNERIDGVTRPALSPLGTMIAFTTFEEENESRIYSYNLATSELGQISNTGRGLPALAWIDEQTLLYTKQEIREGGIVHTTIYKKNLANSDSPTLLVSLPLKGYLMGLAYGDNFVVFGCPTRENIERLQLDQDNHALEHPTQMCWTRVETNDTTREDDYHLFTRNSDYEILGRYFSYGSEYDYEVFFPCKNNEDVALCKLHIDTEEIEKVMSVQKSFYSVAFDHQMRYAFLSDGKLLNFKTLEEVDLKINGRKLDGKMINSFWPFGYREK